MGVDRTLYSHIRVSEMYRMSNCHWAKSSSQARKLLKGDLTGKSDMVQFSQEALDRLKLLQKKQLDDTIQKQLIIQEEDRKLQKSLKMLETDSDASVDEIRRAYLHAIMQYHPDKYAHSPPEFRQLAEAKSKHINALYGTLLKGKTDCPRTRQDP